LIKRFRGMNLGGWMVHTKAGGQGDIFLPMDKY
jgi:hypothetical protein